MAQQYQRNLYIVKSILSVLNNSHWQRGLSSFV